MPRLARRGRCLRSARALPARGRSRRPHFRAELRIGLAYGNILIRLGDVYGEVVNIAARLTSECRPGRVLADRELAAALDGHPDYSVRRLRRVSVRGYHHLIPYALQRAD